MKHVHINLANETIDLDDLYQLENRATMLTIDYTDCNVDDHNKFVEFELSDGEKLRYKAGRAGQLICSLPLDRYVMKEGKLLINPIAILSNPDADYEDPIQSFVSFKTFEVIVMPTINALGEGSEKANDVLDPIIIQLGTQQDWIDAETIRQSTQDQRLAVVEGNEDELFFRLRGLEAGLPDPSGTFNEINSELDDHEARIIDNASRVTDTEDRVTDTEARLDVVEPKVSTLEGEMNAVELRASTLEGEMNAVELKTQHIPSNGTFEPYKEYRKVVEWNTPLTSYTQEGKYYSTNGHQGITTTPNDTNKARFTLDVISVTGWVLQKFMFLDGSETVWTRFFSGSSWSAWHQDSLMQWRGTLPPGDVNTVAYWVKLRSGIYQTVDSATNINSKGDWGIVRVERLYDIDQPIPTAISWETSAGGHQKWNGYYSDQNPSVIWSQEIGGDLEYNLQTANGWTPRTINGQSFCYYRKVDGIVYINAMFDLSAKPTSPAIANLPSGYRPVGMEINGTITYLSSGYSANAWVDVNGNLNANYTDPYYANGWAVITISPYKAEA